MERIGTRTVYENAWMRVREDVVQRQDGSAGIYGVVDKPDFALVIPRGEGGLFLVEQYRYAIGRRAWELPQGSWSGAPTGDARALAASELAEETGLVAARLEHLGHLFVAPGFCSQGFDVFLATGLTAGRPAREPSEGDMVHRFFTDGEFLAMVAGEEIVDAASLSAYALWSLHTRGGPS